MQKVEKRCNIVTYIVKNRKIAFENKSIHIINYVIQEDYARK